MRPLPLRSRPARRRLGLALASALVAPLAQADDLPDDALLQACAYDGNRITIDARAGTPGAARDGAQLVAEIMKFTGLPQNFEVVEHPQVPNAAALIVAGPDRLPKRVIAYNPDFIRLVERATQHNHWAPISIMAHEVGHHLSGHTIRPGGSQPPTELEADAFSGFVLFKMGAALADAERALQALVPEADGPTHPGRAKRLGAVRQGWTQACRQQSDDCSANGTGAAPRPAVPRVAAAPASSTTPLTPAAASVPDAMPAAASASTSSGVAHVPASTQPPDRGTFASATRPESTAPAATDRLPLPSGSATPHKFDRFVYDEFGVLDRSERERVERRMFELARERGVEIVILLVADLHGLDADAYAQAMLRQLRVGKLDVGNGAVLVVAPKQNAVAIAMGPGLMLESADTLEVDRQRLRSFVTYGWPQCVKKAACGNWTSALFDAAEHLAKNAAPWDWTIRYASLEAMQAAARTARDQREASGERYDPRRDPTWRKIVRVEAEVASLDPARSHPDTFINEVHQRAVGPALLARGGAAQPLVLYAHPAVQALMPGGALRAGQRYQFILREVSLDSDTPQFDVLSYASLAD